MTMQLTTHLAFNGNCRQAFAFYESTFGGRILMQLTYGEAPISANGTHGPSAEMTNQIMHARLDIDGQHLMGADAPPGRYQSPQGIMVSVSISDLERARRIFETLASNGKITMPFQETFWARGFGMCIDRFAVPWIVNCEKPLALGPSARTESRTAAASA
jgi:PhnB protein